MEDKIVGQVVVRINVYATDSIEDIKYLAERGCEKHGVAVDSVDFTEEIVSS